TPRTIWSRPGSTTSHSGLRCTATSVSSPMTNGRPTMSFSLPNPPGPPPAPPAAQDLTPRPRPAKRRGLGKVRLVLGALFAAGGAVAMTTVPGLGNQLGLSGLFASPYSGVITYRVERKDLPVTVLTNGALESS